MDQVKLMGNIMNKAWGTDQIFCNLTPLRLRLEKCAVLFKCPDFLTDFSQWIGCLRLESNPNMFTNGYKWWLGGSRIVYLNLS